MRVRHKWVELVNNVMKKSPSNCMVYMLIARTGVFSFGSVVSGVVGVPVELALAFAVTRPLKKVRLPLDMLGAVGLAKVFPVLKRIEVSKLLNGGFGGAQPAMESVEKFWERYPNAKHYWDKSAVMVDSYGAAYFLARDLIGITVCLFTTFLLTHDPFALTDSLLYYTGVSQATAHTFSAIAGGAILSSLSAPFILYAMPSAVKRMCTYYDLDAELAKQQQRLEEKIEAGKKN
eukprot:TRINITY_DN6061_c0_g1_i2.p1 TRINITY_DN6061_c0_g1~~TRINITY_DN6061_c0_g1_i2.p1  ORF type:complete len:247 (+),score=80.08 TRINITY_DN6061_c0_g1_i2:43-741(+)